MRLRYQYVIFIVVLHTILTVLVYQLLRDSKWMFMLSELAIIASLLISYSVYKSLIRPLELMKSGLNAIKDGDYNVKFVETRSADMNELIVVYNTMLDRLGYERLRTQEQGYFLQSIINASPVGMIIMDYDGNISDINQKARIILDIDMLKSKLSLKDVNSQLAHMVLEVEIGESKVLSPDGIRKYKCQVNHVIDKGFHRKFILIEELSEELLENEKAAYGKVIRMMAHEVNNSMGAVNSILQSVIDFGFGDNEEDKEYIEAIIIAKERNEDLAYFMKNFADVIRLPDPVFKFENLGGLMKTAVDVMKPLAISSNIDIRLHKESDDILIKCDASQIQQVLVNILKNAIESIESDGVIQVRLQQEVPQITISDNGPGIPIDVREKLFSPFYSTKPTGQGIGLIITRDILLNHDASFNLATDEESGLTNFTISFKE